MSLSPHQAQGRPSGTRTDVQPRPWPSTQKSHPAETLPCPICMPTDPLPAPSPSAPRMPPAPPALLSCPSYHRAWPKRLLWPVTEQAGPNPVTSGSPIPEPLPAHPPTRDTRQDAQKAPGLGQKGQHQTVSHSWTGRAPKRSRNTESDWTQRRVQELPLRMQGTAYGEEMSRSERTAVE